ncbi:MAG: response regulator transcription factor [Pseudomonadota bacterium]
MRIFLIEDDLAVGRALQSVLQDDGHHVIWVRLAAGACERIAQERFDAVLLDLGLPDGDGLALLVRMRGAGLVLPVLVTTSRDSLEDRLSGFAGGADDYLIKPFDIPELLARLRAVVRRASGRTDDADALWKCRELVLDERRMLLTRGGQPVALSKTEFMLLQALVRCADRVVTRTELENRVLPYSEGQTLDVHISNLRKKIGEGYIRTVRGVGYMVQHDSI